LSDRRANVEKLQRLQLPVLATPADLAKALNLTVPRLRWLAFHSEASAISHYVYFQIPKRSGGVRQLAAPHHDLAACQQWVLANILEKIPVRDAAHGFVPGRSTMSNAVPHAGRSVVVNADLKDFFPTVTFPRVRGIFQEMGFSPAVATILALLCTECPRRKVEYDLPSGASAKTNGKTYYVATGPRALPQGACTSPALSNLAARKLDARLTGLAQKLGWTYTRYADDLTFSTTGEAIKQTAYLLARLRHIVTEENFIVNEKKTRVLRPNAAQTVTGIVVNQRPNVPRGTIRRIRSILHRAHKEGLAAQNRQNHPNFMAWLSGMIAYISMVNPGKGKQLRIEFEALSK
jgi:retron-type reverse transcriptase